MGWSGSEPVQSAGSDHNWDNAGTWRDRPAVQITNFTFWPANYQTLSTYLSIFSIFKLFQFILSPISYSLKITDFVVAELLTNLYWELKHKTASCRPSVCIILTTLQMNNETSFPYSAAKVVDKCQTFKNTKNIILSFLTFRTHYM